MVDLAVHPQATEAVAPHDTGRVRSALVWDSTNTSAVVVARGLRRLGWRVHWLGTATSPWRTCTAFDGERVLIRNLEDQTLLQAFHRLDFDALFLHGDDQVRWMLEHWEELPSGARESVSAPDSLRTALSKERSMILAESLDIPTLPTARCGLPEDVAVESRRLAASGTVVVKGEGGAGGHTMAAVQVGKAPDAATWARVTRHSPVALVQRRIHGPRVFMSTVYEHGVERASCTHEKVAAFPYAFGPTAFGVTRHVDVVHEYAHRMFTALGWHGTANIEFRQDLDDRRWYFMEINPRVNASMGIQEAAGIDIARSWAWISTGRGHEYSPGRTYRDGVRYAWGVRGMALALRRPWNTPAWGIRCLLDGRSDLAHLDPPLRRRALRLAAWLARQPN